MPANKYGLYWYKKMSEYIFIIETFNPTYLTLFFIFLGFCHDVPVHDFSISGFHVCLVRCKGQK